MVILAYAPYTSEGTILCRGGKLLGKLPSAFAAELLALEFGIEIFDMLVGDRLPHDTCTGCGLQMYECNCMSSVAESVSSGGGSEDGHQ